MNEVNQKAALAKTASSLLALADTQSKNTALLSIANALSISKENILSANQMDVHKASNKLSQTMLDRLSLTSDRIDAMVEGIHQVIQLTDPIGVVLEQFDAAQHLHVSKISVPLGVIAIIYEARPNVTVDTAVLCLKSSNAIILRGSSDALETNKVLVSIMQQALKSINFIENCIQLIEDPARQSALDLMHCNQFIDVLIPRGSAHLIQTVIEEAKVPILITGTGNCHIFVDESADLNMAKQIIINAKTSRPSVCNAMEKLLIHEKIAPVFLKEITELLQSYKVEIRLCDKAHALLPSFQLATEEDWPLEYLDLKIAIKLVAHMDEAIAHIQTYTSHHSEAIITQSKTNSQRFLNEIDAAAVYVNASTRFTDGFEFGFGAELGISTQKLHARGPIGLKELCSYKYCIIGEGQIR